jgi:hypothetical protein
MKWYAIRLYNSWAENGSCSGKELISETKNDSNASEFNRIEGIPKS